MLVRSTITDCLQNRHRTEDGRWRFIPVSRAEARRHSFNRFSAACQRCGQCFEGSGIVNRNKADGQQFFTPDGLAPDTVRD